MSASASHDVRLTEPTRFEWRWTLVLGVTSVILGLVLLLNPFASAATLALLVGLGMLANGVLELTDARRMHSRFCLFAGIVLALSGVVTLVWPKATLWVIAVMVGAAIMVVGVAHAFVAVSQRQTRQHWVWSSVKGFLGILLGIVAVAWPKATVLVLALLFGVQITALGVGAIAAAFEERRLLHHPTDRLRPT